MPAQRVRSSSAMIGSRSGFFSACSLTIGNASLIGLSMWRSGKSSPPEFACAPDRCRPTIGWIVSIVYRTIRHCVKRPARVDMQIDELSVSLSRLRGTATSSFDPHNFDELAVLRSALDPLLPRRLCFGLTTTVNLAKKRYSNDIGPRLVAEFAVSDAGLMGASLRSRMQLVP